MSFPKDIRLLNDKAIVHVGLYDVIAGSSLPSATLKFVIPQGADPDAVPFVIRAGDLNIMSPNFPDMRFVKARFYLDQDGDLETKEDGVGEGEAEDFIRGELEGFVRIGDHTRHFLQILNETGNCQDCFLQGVDLSGRTLAGANLRNTELGGAKLKYTNLEHADLSGAKFFGVDFSGTNLTGAIITGTNFSYANLTGALTDGLDFSKAIVCFATLPDGSTGWGLDCQW